MFNGIHKIKLVKNCHTADKNPLVPTLDGL